MNSLTTFLRFVILYVGIVLVGTATTGIEYELLKPLVKPGNDWVIALIMGWIGNCFVVFFLAQYYFTFKKLQETERQKGILEVEANLSKARIEGKAVYTIIQPEKRTNRLIRIVGLPEGKPGELTIGEVPPNVRLVFELVDLRVTTVLEQLQVSLRPGAAAYVRYAQGTEFVDGKLDFIYDFVEPFKPTGINLFYVVDNPVWNRM